MASFRISFRRRSPNPKGALINAAQARIGPLHTTAERASSAENDVREEILAKVHVDAIDGVYNNLVYTCVLLTNHLGVKQELWRAEAFRAELCGHVNINTRCWSIATYLDSGTVRQSVIFSSPC